MLLPIVFIYTGRQDQIVPKNVVKVKVQEGVTTIREEAFEECDRLENITFPASVELIEEWAFYDCTSLLAEVDLSSTAITIIGYGAFRGCTSLCTIALPTTLESIEGCAFEHCTSLAKMDLSFTAVTKIGYGAFRLCTSMCSIKLPNNTLESIEGCAFEYCTSLAKDLSSICIPRTVKHIGPTTFKDNESLKMVTVPWGADIDLDAFPDCTKVFRLHNWYDLGEYIKMRALVEQNRAVARQDVDDAELQILQKFIVDESNDIFRDTLEKYLCEAKPSKGQTIEENLR